MGSLTDILLWGGLALVLGCALLLTVVWAVILREEETGKRRSPRQKSRRPASSPRIDQI